MSDLSINVPQAVADPLRLVSKLLQPLSAPRTPSSRGGASGSGSHRGGRGGRGGGRGGGGSHNGPHINMRELETQLEQLCTTTFPVQGLRGEDAVELLHPLAKLQLHPTLGSKVPDSLFSKFTYLLNTILLKQKCRCPGGLITDLIRLLLRKIEHKNTSSPMVVSALRSLSYVLFEAGGRCTKLHVQILEVLTPLASGKGHHVKQDPAVQRLAVNCLGNVTAKGGTKCQGLYGPVYTVLAGVIKYLTAGGQWDDDTGDNVTIWCDLAAAALRAMRYVILESNKIYVRDLSQLLGTLKCLMFFGTRHQVTAIRSAPRTHFPAVPFDHAEEGDRSTVGDTCGGRSAHLWGSHTVPSGPGTVTSDSSETEASGASVRGKVEKVRLFAIACIQSIARSSPKECRPHWSLFVPQRVGTSASPTNPTLVTVIVHEESARVRSAACDGLTAFLENGKQYLSTATDKASKSSSFTSLSQTLGAMLHELHHGLLVAANQEQVEVTQSNILHCFAALINATPYARLSRQPHVLTETLQGLVAVKRLSMGPQAMLSWYQCMGAAVMAQAPTPQVAAFLSPGTEAGEQLLDLVFTVATDDSASEAHRIAVMQIAGKLGRYYHKHFAHTWTRISDTVAALHDHDSDKVRAGAIKLVEEYCAGLRQALPMGEVSLEESSIVWGELAGLHLGPCFEDEYPGVRASVCMCITTIPEPVFDVLTQRQRALFMTMMLGAAQDADASVRANAFRSLGTLLTFASVRDDGLFTGDVAVAINEASRDDNLAVRVRVCWTLANLCDCLRTSPSLLHTGDFGPRVVEQLFNVAFQFAADSEKVRSNAVRALGYLTLLPNFIPGSEPHAADAALTSELLLSRVLTSLLANISAGSVKVRWNACYAVSNVFQNQHAMSPDMIPHIEPAVQELIYAVQNGKNSKIRINAAFSLGFIPSRQHFGDSLPLLWSVLTQALQTINDVKDFKELKYKNALQSQLAATLCRVCSLLDDDDDVAELSDSLIRDGDSLLSGIEFLVQQMLHPGHAAIAQPPSSPQNNAVQSPTTTTTTSTTSTTTITGTTTGASGNPVSPSNVSVKAPTANDEEDQDGSPLHSMVPNMGETVRSAIATLERIYSTEPMSTRVHSSFLPRLQRLATDMTGYQGVPTE